LIEKSAEFISNNLPQQRPAMTVVAKRFNEIIGKYWVDIIDFLKLHYVLSERYRFAVLARSQGSTNHAGQSWGFPGALALSGSLGF
jgi:hypothetical protein